MNEPSKASEWRQSWPIPLIGLVGVTGPAAFAYSSGVFMEAMTGEFGWSRAQYSSAFTIQMLLGLVVAPLAGRILDRIGPRRLVLAGMLPFALGLSLMGLADGSAWQWWLLAAIYAPLGMGMITAAWISGAMSSFDASRGLAISVVLAGFGVATAAWPVIAAQLSQAFGWRMAFPVMAIGWVAIVFPITYLFYWPKQGMRDKGKVPQLQRLAPISRSRTFLCMLGAGTLFSSVQFALILHLVPILQDQGLGLEIAATCAAVTGVFSVIGRLATGYLLDHFPVRVLAAFAFPLPIAVMIVLALSGGYLPAAIFASALLGFSAGSEIDIVTYLATRRFHALIFGTVYSVFGACFAVSASLGPLLAGRAFDLSGSYVDYFLIAGPMVLLATALILAVPMDRTGAGLPHGQPDPV